MYKTPIHKTPTRFWLSPRVGRSVPSEYFTLTTLRFEGAVIGHHAGRPIHETVIDGKGCRYNYAGVAPRDVDGHVDIESLRPGEWIVEPGLVYLFEDDGPLPRQG
jgi:hypothetical protein